VAPRTKAAGTKAAGTKAGSRQHGTGAGPAARRAVRQNGIEVNLPLVGELCLPAPERLAWYAGIATLVVLGMVEWPVALVITVGHLLGEDHHNRLIEDFGAALEAEA
jgi:hypothetical protein